MSKLAQHGHKTTGNRALGPRLGGACGLAGSLALALPLALAAIPAATAQSSNIYINNDVLNSLGPGPSNPAPLAPAAPTTPSSANDTMTFQVPAQAPVFPPAGQAQNGLGFQTYGSGNYVVTRPSTLLFPPLEAPTSTLTPGFADNDAARVEAMNNAFAAGPEPSSQLLIPLHNEGGSGDSVVVYMENLPPADPTAAAGSAPQLTLQQPLAAPEPAPRKPEVSPEMLAEADATAIDDDGLGLAPEFQASEPEAPAPAEEAPVAMTSEAPAKAPTPAGDQAAPAMNEPAAPMTQVAEETAAPQISAPANSAPVSSAEVAAPVTSTNTSAMSAAPVSLLPDRDAAPAEAAETPAASAEVAAPIAAPAIGNDAMQAAATVQTASLNVGQESDISVLFDGDSAELSANVQNELRSLANSMHASEERRIQVLGFASAEGGSEDLARKLALSRALKVRTFLIDAGVASTRIQVRSLGDKSEGGPANRVDIRPIDS